jgi:hypothetical protein
MTEGCMTNVRRIVTGTGGATTHCHDIFGYCRVKSLILVGYFRPGTGCRYALRVSWYQAYV